MKLLQSGLVAIAFAGLYPLQSFAGELSGVEELLVGNPRAAIEKLEVEASNGDAIATTYLAVAHRFGWGVKYDSNRAFQLADAAADAGVAAAVIMLAEDFDQEIGVSAIRDAKRSATRQAKKGDALSLYYVARVSEQDVGAGKFFEKLIVEPAAAGLAGEQLDPNAPFIEEGYLSGKAKKYYEKASEKGFAPATAKIASFIEKGRGYEKDMRTAVKLHADAAQRDLSLSQAALGYFYVSGKNVEKDMGRGVDLLHQAAEKKNYWSANALGVMYRDGDYVEQDYGKAMSFFEIGAEGNDNAKKNLDALMALLAEQERTQAVKAQVAALREQHADAIDLAEKAAQFWLYTGMQDRCATYDIESGAELFWTAYSDPPSAAYGSSENVWDFVVCTIGIGAVHLQVVHFIEIDKAKAAGRIPYNKETLAAIDRDCDGVYNLPESEKMDATPEQVVGLLESCVPTILAAIEPLLPYKKQDSEIMDLLVRQRLTAIDRAREKRVATNPFTAVISCYAGPTKIFLASCFSDTHLKVTRENRAKIYEPWDFDAAGEIRGDSLYINLPSVFEVKAQNGTRGLVLAVQILDYQDNVLFEDQAAQYQSIYVGN